LQVYAIKKNQPGIPAGNQEGFFFGERLVCKNKIKPPLSAKAAFPLLDKKEGKFVPGFSIN
jgi:hypothetical protein